jgi:molybdopterin-guanine dinucleotide biosynthesis protein A
VSEAITGVVLAGGRGQRMGGVDKGFVMLAGRPMVEHVLAALAPQVQTLAISANRSLERYAAYGHPVITDSDPDFQGPLAGMAAVLARIDTPLTLFVPCDGPQLPRDLAARLRAALDGGTPAAMASDGERLQPAHALIRTELAARLAADVAAGERRIANWLRGVGAAVVDFSDQAEAFANVNTPEERDRLACQLADATRARHD